MSEPGQIPRTSLAWLLVAQLTIFVPHTGHSPLWLWAIWLWVALWRWQIFRGAWSFPRTWVKLLLMGLTAGGLALSYRGSFGMETMVSLLLVAFMLKLLELRRRRDLLVICYLGYFIAATQLLFYSNLLAALYGLVSIVVLTATLLASHQSLAQYRFWRTFRGSGLLLAQALPLMLILFVVIPRTGALWAVPTESGGATTGMSDSMAPGDLSNLAQSDALAFRVTFDDPAPGPIERYWRGLVFSYFDGRQWRQTQREQMPQLVDWNDQSTADWRAGVEYRGRPVRYQVMLEPTNERWLYSLSAPAQWGEEIGIGMDLRLQRREPVRRRIQYQVTSQLDYRYQPDQLADWERRQALQLPADSNPETRARIASWREQAGSDQALIERLLDHYRARFRYTLQPQALGRHTVDEFLWQTQAGFCEHFASSFVFALRAADIPSRVVVGYQGGELNPLEDYWMVRQRDAHAWAEVWLEGRGWVRHDPTAAVAPSRIERGLSGSLSAEDDSYLAQPFGGDMAFLNRLQLRWDMANYHWSRWVLGYDRTLQEEFLGDWLGGSDPWRVALVVVCGSGALVGLLALGIWWRQRPRYRYPADRYYARFSRRLDRLGLGRKPGEGPRAYARRLSRERPELADQAMRVAHLYELVNYAGNRAALADLRRAVGRLRWNGNGAGNSERGARKGAQ